MKIKKKKRKSCSPWLDNFEKPLEGRDRVFLSLASASSREPGTYQAGTQYLLAETKQKGNAFLNPVRFYFLDFWLRWAFVAACGPSLAVASRSCSVVAVFSRAPHSGGFSRCRAQAWAQAP